MSLPRQRRELSIRRLALHATWLLLLPVIALTLPPASASATPKTCATADRILRTASSIPASACWHPFSLSSPFNTKLPGGPALASDNAAVKQHMASYGWMVGSSSTGFSIGADDGTRPVYFASPSDPVVTIHCTSEEGTGTCQGANRIDINGARINLPAGAKPASNWDAHMTIIEKATGTEYDLWHASISGSTLTAGTGAQISLYSTGTGSGGDAAGFALTAGLLRPSELIRGQINHALVITVPCTNATGANVGYTWPAEGGWGEHCGQYWNEQASNAPELGQLVKLNMTDTEIANSPAPAWQKTIMTALSHYGAYIEDTNGSWRNEGMYIETQDPASWTNLGQTNQWATAVSDLGGTGTNLSSHTPILTSNLELVDTCVTQGTCPNASTGQPSANGTSRHRPLAIAAGASRKRSGAKDKKRTASRHRTRRGTRRVQRRDVERAAATQTAFARRRLGA